MHPFSLLPLTLSLCLLQPAFSNDEDSRYNGTGRVINGSPVKAGKYKFMVSIQMRGKGHFCGGSILNDDSILTAAHCVVAVSDPSKIVIEMGSVKIGGGVVKIGASETEHHKSFSMLKLGQGNDVAVIKLKKKIDFDKYKDKLVKSCLAGEGDEPVKDKCVVMGWGYTSYGGGRPSKVLLETVLPWRDPDSDACQEIGPFDTDNLLCAQRDDASACNGDSGSPYVCPEKKSGELLQFGLVSFGKIGCPKASATFYTKVSNYIDWIQPIAED